MREKKKNTYGGNNSTSNLRTPRLVCNGGDVSIIGRLVHLPTTIILRQKIILTGIKLLAKIGLKVFK